MERMVKLVDGKPMVEIPKEYGDTDIKKLIYGMIVKLCAYEEAEESGELVRVPLKIGDRAWAVRIQNRTPCAFHGVVSDISINENMRLVVSVKGIARGVYGEKIFSTREDACAAIRKIKEERLKS